MSGKLLPDHYDNHMLNYPSFFTAATKAFGVSKAIELGKSLSPELIDMAATSGDIELLLAGASSLGLGLDSVSIV